MENYIDHPITFENWKEIPVFNGRLATQDDVVTGKAIFCSTKAEAELVEVSLPFCAKYTDEKTGKRISIIAVQVEKVHHDEVIVGALEIDGESLVCTFSELEIVEDPDQTFFIPQSEDPLSPTISVRKAVAIDHLLVSLPVIVIILGFIFLGGQFAPHFILIFLFVGIILGWLWWAFTVPRWRRWALHRGVQPDELQKLAASTGLVWPKGSIFEKTEFKVDE